MTRWILFSIRIAPWKNIKTLIHQNLLPVQVDGLYTVYLVTTGLKFLNLNGLIHKNIKPSHTLFLLMGKDVFVKLSDFEISMLLAPGISSRIFWWKSKLDRSKYTGTQEGGMQQMCLNL